MQSILEWLVTLPTGALYTIIGVTAALENLVPPFPSDVVVAFGSFVAAQGNGTAFGVFITTWAGNVIGAMVVYALGRRYGADRLEKKLAGKAAETRDARLRSMLTRYGLPAVFLSRFIPGVRALVPAVAGAAKLSIGLTALMIGLASAIWYGLITILAFRVGSDWERLRTLVGRYASQAAIGGSVLLLLGIATWLILRHRGRK